jgi:3-oxoacyl-[acyl-carrier protein] reductase
VYLVADQNRERSKHQVNGRKNRKNILAMDGKTALVTGGSRGIGRATCELLAEYGASVVVNFRSREGEAARVAKAIAKAGGRATAVGADIADPEQAHALVEEAVRLYGRLDVLVNNAGIWEEGPLLTMSPARWHRTLAINLDGTFYCAQAAARVMKRQRSGRIVNLSSTAGQRGEALHGQYAATKGAVIALTKSWAPELAPYGIYVNCVAPGWVDTEMTAESLQGAGGRAISRAIPLRRVGTARDIAAAVLFLASDACRFVTGEIFNINGGAVLCG